MLGTFPLDKPHCNHITQNSRKHTKYHLKMCIIKIFYSIFNQESKSALKWFTNSVDSSFAYITLECIWMDFNSTLIQFVN